jgi:hypothetical protein
MGRLKAYHRAGMEEGQGIQHASSPRRLGRAGGGLDAVRRGLRRRRWWNHAGSDRNPDPGTDRDPEPALGEHEHAVVRRYGHAPVVQRLGVQLHWAPHRDERGRHRVYRDQCQVVVHDTNGQTAAVTVIVTATTGVVL